MQLPKVLAVFLLTGLIIAGVGPPVGVAEKHACGQRRVSPPLSTPPLAELGRVKYLARAYVYEPQDFHAFEKTYWQYEDFRPFYENRIEVQIDDYYASQIRNEVITEYDIIILTTPRETLSPADKSILEKFDASKGIVIDSTRNAYGEIQSLRYRFESSQLRSKQETYIWEYHSANLDIYYPEVLGWFTPEDARKNAGIAEQFYGFAQDVIDERPFGGAKISIAFFKYRSNSMAGQMIRMGIVTEQGKLFPPSWTFYHELAHDFSSNDGEPDRPRTSTAAYLDINIAFEEVMANLFAYYFDSTFRYDMNHVRMRRSLWESMLREYENAKVDPYSLNWHGHNRDQQYLEAMLFNVSESYGWQTWNSFFRIAKMTGMPRIPPGKQMKMEDLTQWDASIAFSRLVYLLSLAAGDDLRPQFERWRFRIEPEIKALMVNKIRERPTLLLTISSNSVVAQATLGIKGELRNLKGNPIANETLLLFLEDFYGVETTLGRAETNALGVAEVRQKMDVDVGIYWVVASYEGSSTYLRKRERTQVVVKPLEWVVLSDRRFDLVGQDSMIAGDLQQPYVDLAALNYSFSGTSLYFRFALYGKIPSETASTGVQNIWYQVLLDVDSNSSTGYRWSSDFTPDYVLILYAEFGTPSGTPEIQSYVQKYSGSGRDFKWATLEKTRRFGAYASPEGGVGYDFFILACDHEDISVSKKSTIKFFARSGIRLQDGKIYNDPIPDTGTISLNVLLTQATTTFSVTPTTSIVSTSSLERTRALEQTPTIPTNEILLSVGLLSGTLVVVLLITKSRKGKKQP